MRAIELNGVAVEDNRAAFLWGRRAAFDADRVERLASAAEPALPAHRLSRDVDELVERRRDYLVAYQNAAYARRYTELVARAREAERRVDAGSTAFAEAVARGWFRLLARKDAYEVARLYTDGEFERALRATFDGDFRLHFHLGVPRRVARFVCTLGATANMNGTALFEGVTVLFLAQFFGVELTMFQQVTILLLCILGGIGAAGVPGGSLPVIAMILAMFGIPPEGIGLILGVDRLLDMCRTVVNVGGDMVGAVVIGRSEGGQDDAPAQRAATG